MLPKLHKTKRINEIIQKKQCEYINVEENIILEARPILAGCIYHSSGILEILHIIMEPSLVMTSHIAPVLIFNIITFVQYCFLFSLSL